MADKILITGKMGSGKTLVANALSDNFGYTVDDENRKAGFDSDITVRQRINGMDLAQFDSWLQVKTVNFPAGFPRFMQTRLVVTKLNRLNEEGFVVSSKMGFYRLKSLLQYSEHSFV